MLAPWCRLPPENPAGRRAGFFCGPLEGGKLRSHLTGKKAIGIYPLLMDETCWLLAADFDKKTWQDDALAFIATCRRLKIPAYLERSRSGDGGHVWMFF